VAWTSHYIDLFKFDQMRPEYLARAALPDFVLRCTSLLVGTSRKPEAGSTTSGH
jgi:hypothetical protein